MNEFNPGDYVLATKYSDGDPFDHWGVGFYKEFYQTCTGEIRHIIVNNNDIPYRANGFRRVKKISPERGKFIIDHTEDIIYAGRSLWCSVHVNMKKINQSPPPHNPKSVKFAHALRNGLFTLR